MKKLAIVLAVGAAALLGGSAANAVDNTVKAKAATDASESTDFSSHRRHWRHRHWHHRHWHHGHYPRYYRSYGYGPGISLYFGGGRHHHRHHRHRW
jgi:hypothetical protein